MLKHHDYSTRDGIILILLVIALVVLANLKK